MRLVIQRVKKAAVEVDSQIVGQISHGLLVFLAIHKKDHKEQIPWFVNKLIHMRIFSDEKGKMNKSLIDTKGSVLLISQFTLYADCSSSGRRPSFTESAPPEYAQNLYEIFFQQVKEKDILIQSGTFGAKMLVSSINDGPITMILDGP